MKKPSGNLNLPTKTGNYLPNIKQTKQVIQQANVNHKALSNILNSRDPEFWLEKVRAALDKEAWTEAAYYGLKALFYDETFIKADIVLAYTFGRLRDIDKSLFYMEKVDRFGEVEAEVYRSLLSREELYFLSIWYGICFGIEWDKQFNSYVKKLDEISQTEKLDLSNEELLTKNNLKKIVLKKSDIFLLRLFKVQLQELPKEIGELVYLTSLRLSDNKLQELPKEIGRLKNLINLELGGNQLKKLPSEIGRLKNLTSLCLLNNHKLQELPREIGQLVNLTYLSLASNQLKKLPKEIGQLVNMRKLDLNGNQLQELPKEIGQLINLKILDLGSAQFRSKNKLSKLPKEIGQLVTLTSLRLSDNKLQELPKEIGLLVNLKDLYLSNNQLQKLPREIGQLKNLRRLFLSNNQLQELPKEIGQLVNLRRLGLIGNQLQELPKEIEHIKKLLPNCSISW